MRRLTAFLAAGLAGLLAASTASPAPQAAPPTELSGVDVVAPAPLKTPPTRAEVEHYVGSLGVVSLDGHLAVWSRTSLPTGVGGVVGAGAGDSAGATVCPRVLGLSADYAEFITRRLREVGQALGAPVSQKPCGPLDDNLVIVFPNGDVDAFVQRLARDQPLAFGFPSHGALVEALKGPLAPVQAWYGVKEVTFGRRPSRLQTPDRTVITQVLIIVDTDRTQALDMGQLRDYLTMIALAQIRPERTPPGAASILNVFADTAAGRPAAQGMTRLDAAYLQALYAVGPRQPAGQQNDEIAGRIRRALRGR